MKLNGGHSRYAPTGSRDRDGCQSYLTNTRQIGLVLVRFRARQFATVEAQILTSSYRKIGL
jgi:hypothetical protein